MHRKQHMGDCSRRRNVTYSSSERGLGVASGGWLGSFDDLAGFQRSCGLDGPVGLEQPTLHLHLSSSFLLSVGRRGAGLQGVVALPAPAIAQDPVNDLRVRNQPHASRAARADAFRTRTPRATPPLARPLRCCRPLCSSRCRRSRGTAARDRLAASRDEDEGAGSIERGCQLTGSARSRRCSRSSPPVSANRRPQ